ncbi:HlyD family efflux transporter periplasmic adaptor subunit [Herbidospora cretacea]|uniref:HlyD family efflux transporter periplasmic adaptor subunit n=1 Tax=Herbidospora cretacea TaxID=28444 RepID=UPI0007735D63|nr:HlyD family efflux transporter periplasmic adaptor subunit [Herbidospora cretacea]
MTRTRLRAGGLALAAVALVTTGAFVTSEDAPPLPDVELVAAQRGDVTSVASAAGNTIDDGTHDLAFSTAGTVKKVYVRIGDQVRKGDLLARVDDTIARENHEAAKASLAAAEEQLAEVAGSGATGGSFAAPQPRAQTTCPPTTPRPQGKPSASPASSPSPSPSPTHKGIRAAAVSFTKHPTSTRHPTRSPFPSPSATPRPQGDPEVHLDPAPSPTPSPSPTPTSTPQQQPQNCDQGQQPEQPQPQRPRGGGTRPAQGGGGPQTTEAQAEAAVTKAKNDLTAAEDALKGVVIKAPAAGTVLQINGVAGDPYTEGAFVSLGDLNDLQVKAYFTQSDIGSLKPGQQAAITLRTTGGTHQGRVSHIDPMATTTDRLVRYGVTISFDAQPKGLLLGQTATVQVVTGEARGAVYVPARAVQNDTVTLPGGAKRKVTTGVRSDTLVEIRSGLTEGEKVRLPGASALNGEFPDSTFPGL